MNPPSTSERSLTSRGLISPNYGAMQLDDNDIITAFVPRLDGSVCNISSSVRHAANSPRL